MTRAGSTPTTDPSPDPGYPSGDALAPSRVIEELRHAGLVDDETMVEKGVLVEQAGRSHPVYRIAVGGQPFAYLKSFGRRRGETDGSPAREAAIAELATQRGAVTAVHPEVLPWSGAPRVTVTRAVPGRPAWADDTGAASAGDWEAFVALTVPPLAAFHRGTRDLAAPEAAPPPELLGREPWALRLFSGDASPELWGDPRIGAVLASAGSWPSITEGIRAARELWTPLCVIHGDLKHDNILVVGDRVVFVDWEMAHLGDPAWDLAALASHLPLMDNSDHGFGEEVIAGIAVLASSYGQASGLRPQALLRRLIPYLGAWLLMTTIQHRSTGTDTETDQGVASIFRKTRYAFTATESLTRAIADDVT